MDCPKCGTTQPYATDFCLSCGAPLHKRGLQRMNELLSFEELFGTPTFLQSRYEIEKRIRRSHATTVYLARDQALGRYCVIKEFNPRRLADDFERQEAQRSLHAEAVRWAQIRHPNLVRIQDMFIENGRSYLVMELVRGRSLRRLVADPRASFSEVDAVSWILQIGEALAFLHAQEPPLIFGDLHPGHVLITTKGQVKLVDFGLGAWFRPWERGSPRYQGSPGYAAPEQRERWEADERSDLYALGGLLYFLLTRQAPNQPPLRLDELPPALAQIVRRARQRSPERRFASAQAMCQALRAAKPEEQPVVSQIPKPVTSSVPASPARPAPATSPEVSDPWDQIRAQLAEQARADWLRAVRRFYGGQTLIWLQREARRLAQAGQPDAVQAIEDALAAAETLAARGELEDALGRQVFVARWLAEIGATPADPGFAVYPRRLVFQGLTRRLAKRVRVRIQNDGPGVLVGEVESLVSWLEVRNGRFRCQMGEEVRVVVVAHGRHVPIEGERADRALRVITNRGIAWVSAAADLVVPSLTVRPTVLDFGHVAHDEPAYADLIIANEGGGEVQGTVKSTVTWLSVTPHRFHVGAGEQQTLRVCLHGELAPREGQEAPDVLAVDSDYGQARVAVRWHWAEPQLSIMPRELAWGRRAREGEAEMLVTLANTGTAPLKGRVTSRCSWLRVEPEEFTCPAGESLGISVHASFDELPAGRLTVGEAIVIESNAGRRALSASVEVLAPDLRVKPLLLDLGEAEWGKVRRASLRLMNAGTMPLTAHLESQFPWLHLDPTDLVCPPGDSARVAVEAHTEEMTQGGNWQDVPAVHIESNAGQRDIPIFFLVHKPELQVTPEFLDFGVIPRQEVGEITLYISNPGTAPLIWTLSSDALWLEVSMAQGTTPPGETAQVHLYAYGLAVPIDQDEAEGTLTISSNAGELRVPGNVVIARPQLWVAPPELDLGISVNYASVEGILSLFNRGVGDLVGSVRAAEPWLTIEPTEFRIPTGGQQPIAVRAAPQDLPEGETILEGALEVISNAGQEQVDIRIEVQLTGQLVVEPERLAWTLGQKPPRLALRNAGFAPLSVTVQPQADWLRVDHELLVVKRGRTARVAISLDEEALPADPVVETELLLQQADQVTRVPVSIMRHSS